MKTVCALVCLALAHGVSASIFKRSHRPEDSLIVQPLDYINPYQPVSSHQSLYPTQERTYGEYIHSQLQQQQQQYQQEQQQQYQQEQQQQYQKQQQQYQKQQQKKHQYSGSDSASHESSQESREKKNDQYVNIRSDQKWNTPLFTAVMKVQNEIEPNYGQNILWPLDLMVPQVLSQKKKQQGDELKNEIEKIFAEALQAMKHPTDDEKVNFETDSTYNEDEHLNATELLKKNHYPVEEHTIKTDDGYYLTLIRIPPKKQIRDVTKKPVVFLMHGLLGSADDWLLMGPGKSLAYLLSDAGYDVWLGNARGNKYSRHHVSKHPALNDFWQFSNDEVALHDLPAMIDYTLETTNQEKLYYVGHSQGATVFFGLTATLPEYNDKIIMMHALAPMVYMQHTRSPLIRMIAPSSPFEDTLHHQLGHGAFEPSKELIATVGGSMLEKEIGSKNVSSNVEFVMAGVNIESLTPELTQVIVSHVPAGASTKMIKHYGQLVSSDEFKKYDYGPKINVQVYGSAEPPKYDMQKVQAPVTLYYSEEDWLAHPMDVSHLKKSLPTPVTAYKVPDEHFSHMDFQFSSKAPELVYKQLIDSMNNDSSKY